MFLVPANEAQLEFIKKEECYQSHDSLEQDVTHLIEWLSKQPHLPNITDRKWLWHFIVGCKYNLQRTKQVIESYFISRAENPEFFGSCTKELIDQDSKYQKFSLFPKLTPDGCRVLCIRINLVADTNESEFDVNNYCKMVLAVIDLILKEEPMYGSILLYDLKYLPLSRLLAFTPTVTKNIVKCSINSFPVRLKHVIFINPPKFINRLVTFFKLFVHNKIKNRMIIHEKLEDLQKQIPKDVLPVEYGGTCGSIEKMEADYGDFLISNQEWLARRPIADLSKLPDQTKSDKLDMSGTFKKLEID